MLEREHVCLWSQGSLFFWRALFPVQEVRLWFQLWRNRWQAHSCVQATSSGGRGSPSSLCWAIALLAWACCQWSQRPKPRPQTKVFLQGLRLGLHCSARPDWRTKSYWVPSRHKSGHLVLAVVMIGIWSSMSFKFLLLSSIFLALRWDAQLIHYLYSTLNHTNCCICYHYPSRYFYPLEYSFSELYRVSKLTYFLVLCLSSGTLHYFLVHYKQQIIICEFRLFLMTVYIKWLIEVLVKTFTTLCMNFTSVPQSNLSAC